MTSDDHDPICVWVYMCREGSSVPHESSRRLDVLRHTEINYHINRVTFRNYKKKIITSTPYQHTFYRTLSLISCKDMYFFFLIITLKLWISVLPCCPSNTRPRWLRLSVAFRPRLSHEWSSRSPQQKHRPFTLTRTSNTTQAWRLQSSLLLPMTSSPWLPWCVEGGGEAGS